MGREKKHKPRKQGLSGNPAVRAQQEAEDYLRPRPYKKPVEGDLSLENVTNWLRFQIAEAARRGEHQKAEEYLAECAANASMTRVILTRGVGAIPSEVMEEALREVGYLQAQES